MGDWLELGGQAADGAIGCMYGDCCVLVLPFVFVSICRSFAWSLEACSSLFVLYRYLDVLGGDGQF